MLFRCAIQLSISSEYWAEITYEPERRVSRRDRLTTFHAGPSAPWSAGSKRKLAKERAMFWIYLIRVLLAYSFTRNIFLSVFPGLLALICPELGLGEAY